MKLFRNLKGYLTLDKCMEYTCVYTINQSIMFSYWLDINTKQIHIIDHIYGYWYWLYTSFNTNW